MTKQYNNALSRNDDGSYLEFGWLPS